MEGVIRLRSDTDRRIHDLRYGPERLPVGNLCESGKLSGEDEAELEVCADQSKDLYLRSFAGGSYSNGIWEPLPGAAYGDIPPEVYEERTIQTLLRKLNVAVTGSGLRAWLPAAVR